MHGVTLRLQGSKCVLNLQEDFFFVKFDSRRDDGELNISCVFLMSLALFVVHYTLLRVSQIWRTQGGRETVTKDNKAMCFFFYVSRHPPA